MYIALIGDIIESKQVDDREQLQIDINRAFDRIHQKFSDIILSKFTLTLGDEFQALLEPSPKVFELLDHLEMHIPVPFRYGLGYGDLATAFDKDVSIGADGPAYWHARAAIDEVHERNWSGKTRGYVVSGDERFDRVMNNLLVLSDNLKYDWTPLQRETFEGMLEEDIYSQVFNQKAFAERMGISESSLSKRLNAGNIKMYLYTRWNMGTLLEGLDG